MCDLLLLNASNFAGHIVYPYAFVQIFALARINDLTVERFDFLNTPSSRQNLAKTHAKATVV